MDLTERLQDLHDEALNIRATAETENRNLTPAECARLDGVFAEFDAVQGLIERTPGRRQTSPNSTSAGPMSQYTPTGGGGRGGISSVAQYLDRGRTPTDHIVDARGNVIPVLASSDKFYDLVPRGDRCEPGDLAAFVFGAVSGDWSKLSSTATRVMGQMGGSSDAAGGYLLPSPLSAEIFDVLRSASVFAQALGVRVIPMSSRTLDFAGVLNTVDPVWRAEHQPIPESEITLGPVQLVARNLGGMVRVSEELLEDAPNASQLIRDQLAKELAAELDRALFFGSGGLEPTGLVNQTNVPTSSTVGTPTSYAPLMAALGALWGRNVDPRTLVLSSNTRITLASLATGATGDLSQLPVPRELANLQWLTTNKMGGAGSPQESSAIMGDFSGALIGMRWPLRIEVSNTGGWYESDSPPVTGDAFARVQVRVRGVLRADLALSEPHKFQVLEGITD